MNPICKICGSKNIRPYFAKEHRIIQCQKCKVVFLSPGAVNYQPEIYYSEESHYSKLPADWEIERGRENARDALKLINRHIKPSGKNLLDIGSHVGLFVEEATKFGFRAEGIEPNKAAVAWAKDHNIPLYSFGVEAFSPNKRYDTMTLFHVLEHMPNPRAALEKLAGCINKGGYLIVEVPNIDSYLARKDGPAWKFIALEHLFYFSDKTLRKILRDLSFRIVAAKKRNFDIRYLNLKKIFRYFWGKPLARKRLVPKEEMRREKETPTSSGFIKPIIKKILIGLIRILGREDHILIIAQKI